MSAKKRRPTPSAPLSATAASKAATLRISWPKRLILLFTCVVLPIICFALSFLGERPFSPEWQSGDLRDYAGVLLWRGPSIPLYPFLLYNMICLTLLVLAPQRFAGRFVVRFGVYTGALLSVQYWILVMAALGCGPRAFATMCELVLASLLVVFVPWSLGVLVGFVGRRIGSNMTRMLTATCALGLIAAVNCADDPIDVLRMGGIVALACATPWAAASYITMSIYAIRHSGIVRLRFTLIQFMSVLTWWGAYLGAWRLSYLWMLEEYSRLPTSPSQDCYVCSAAARGHRRLVGSKDYHGPGGEVCLANEQMRRLKAFELMFASLNPAGHAACRRFYDAWGPWLAAALVHPLFADVAYLSLKPLEWLARGAMALLVPGHIEQTRRLYNSKD